MRAALSIEEAIATITRSSLPTVITEGRNDYTAYRKIEERLADIGVSLLPMTGRESVLSVWQGLPSACNDRVFFIVDKDCWVYTNIPNQYQCSRIATTNGYSIENDLFMDGNLLELCSVAEKQDFLSEVEYVCKWHAPKIAQIASGGNAAIGDHPTHILSQPEVDISSHPPQVDAWFKNLLEKYDELLRGKTLFYLLVRQLSKKNRAAKFSYSALLEVGSKNPGQFLLLIEAKIREYFSEKYS